MQPPSSTPAAIALHPTIYRAGQTALDLISASGAADQLLNLKKERVRQGVLDKVQTMLDIDRLTAELGNIGKAVSTVALSHKGKRGFSVSKLRDDYKLWRDGGQKQDSQGNRSGTIYAPREWKIFLPNYSNGNRAAALKNADFCHHIQRMFADTCREDATGNALFQRLLDQWFAGDDVPGFGNIRQFCAEQGRPVPTGALARSRAENYPEGWSVSNLRRMLPSKTKRVYIQRGEHAAHSHWGDQLLRDRSKLMPFELLTFDDVRFDIKVIQPMPKGPAQVVYPEAIFALDVATGYILNKFVLGTYKRDDDGDGGRAGTKRGFQHADMRWGMTSLLEQYGLPQDWQMHVLLENASASMSAADQRTFETLTGIKFDTTGLIRQRLTASGFIEQGGMPWQKGWIEALFRLVHTRTNHLPGTIGRRYDLTNGRRAQEEKYTLRTLLDAHKQGIPISELQLPLLTIEEFHDLLDQYVHLINWRTRHSLQGFQKVHELEYQPGQWIRHDDPLCAQLATVGAQFSTRMEAPAERFARLMNGHRMQPVHPRQLFPLRLDKKPITIAAEKVTIKQSGADDLIFRDAECAHHLATWNGRKKALLGFIAADQSCVHLFSNDDDLTYICSPSRVGRVDITDANAVLARSGEVHRGREQTRAYAAELMADQEIALSQLRTHNENLLTGGTASVSDAIEQAEAKITKDRRLRASVTETEAGALFTTPAADAADKNDSFESPF